MTINNWFSYKYNLFYFILRKKLKNNTPIVDAVTSYKELPNL